MTAAGSQYTDSRPAINGQRAGLTPKMLALLSYIESYALEHGYTPSFDEMAEHMGLASKSGVHRLVTALVDRGYITRIRGRARSIATLTNDVTTARALEIIMARLKFTTQTARELSFHLAVERNTFGNSK